MSNTLENDSIDFLLSNCIKNSTFERKKTQKEKYKAEIKIIYYPKG